MPGARNHSDAFLDADLEYDPRDYPALIEPILAGRADVVYGSRFLGAPHRTPLFWHFAANRFLTFASNVFTNINLSDMETCYKVFRAEYARRIVLKSERFGFDPREITARLAHLKCRFYEVPISYYGRDYAEGKTITCATASSSCTPSSSTTSGTADPHGSPGGPLPP